jgi:hypothetical protein
MSLPLPNISLTLAYPERATLLGEESPPVLIAGPRRRRLQALSSPGSDVEAGREEEHVKINADACINTDTCITQA